MIRIIVAGGRDFNDYELLKTKMNEIIKDIGVAEIEIISGHAAGADSLGERYADENNIQCKIFPAEWKKYGSRAGFLRNSQMIDYAKEGTPMVIAFWDGVSRGTKDTVDKAAKYGIRTIIISYPLNNK